MTPAKAEAALHLSTPSGEGAEVIVGLCFAGPDQAFCNFTIEATEDGGYAYRSYKVGAVLENGEPVDSRVDVDGFTQAGMLFVDTVSKFVETHGKPVANLKRSDDSLRRLGVPMAEYNGLLLTTMRALKRPGAGQVH